jgi:signal transduction histidine kinase/CheY-like chemotaxis protein
MLQLNVSLTFWKPVLFARSIRARLLLLVFLAVGASQAAITMLLVWQEGQRYGLLKRDTLFSTAQVLAASASAAAHARDRAAIRTTLRAMSQMPGVTYVAVADTAGRVLADLGATEQLTSDLRWSRPDEPVSALALLSSRSLEVSVPIIRGGETVGHLRLLSDTREFPDRLWSAARTSALGSLAALALALLIALRMQSGITGPLGALTGAMQRVRDRHDYSVSLKSDGRDEIGVLVDGFNEMLADIRERDKRLARHREHLESEVAQRTQDYREARDQAESANRAKSDFLATMSHEIRTPMNGILVMADLLAASDLPPKSRRYAQVIARSGKTLVAIINDILDLSKIEAGKLDVETIPVSVTDVTGNMADLFAERAARKGIDLAVCVEVDVAGHVSADPVRLSQVLANLVNNALKFTERGSVAVRAARDESDPALIRFSVADTGIGIPEDRLGAIFSAFSQADQSTTRKFGGTGLGLTISQRLVRAMGGEISVSSTPGEGSCFSFSLPADLAQGARPVWPLTQEPCTAVLCVQGDASRAALRHYMERTGLTIVETVPSQLSAAARNGTLLIADAQALAALADRFGDSATRIVGLIDLGQSVDGPLTARADAWLERPVSRENMREILSAVCEQRSFAMALRNRRETTALPAWPGAQVLVADDSTVNREVAREALLQFGIDAALADGGVQAVKLCAQQRFDLVLMDGSMPDLDGFEATRLIRAQEQADNRAPVAIVALTAHVVGPIADAWREAGMDGILHKPFTLAAMAKCLGAHLPPALHSATAKQQPSSQSPSHPADALDAALIAQLRELAAAGRGDFLARVTGLYREHAPTTVDELLAAHAAHDSKALAQAAHALKSMSLNIGAQQVAHLAGALEHDVRNAGRWPDPDRIAALGQAVAEACAALENLDAAA